MPRVKIDYVVSFSSEDPGNPASNLLAWDVSKKRWLCPKGESSCSVVLQLTKAVKVNAVHVGAHHAALVEVLVGRSESPNEPFQVLVPSCIFLTPAESRREENVERVRSFSAEQLTASAAAQRWDRVRVVCSQPYNKHCKYGLNFIHVYSPEGTTPPAAALPARVLATDADASSEDEFSPGELFARHRSQHPAQASADTGAQIRQATSQALRNISDSATKLVKTPLAKHSTATRLDRADRIPAPGRRRDDVLYTDDDEKPHAKIDHIVQRHKDEKVKEDARKPKGSEKHDRTKDKNESSSRKEAKKDDSQRESSSDRHKDRGDRTPKDDKKNRPPTKDSRSEPSSSKRSEGENDRKRSRGDQKSKKGAEEPGAVLRGVVFVLSGYANPRRAALRDCALRLGARAAADWGAACTHLICAFPNTPKLRQVRAAAGGADVPVATGEWLEECRRRGRRVPWRWFATEPRHRRAPRADDDDRDDDRGDDRDDDRRPTPEVEEDEDEECDTDDEIEKALRKQKKRRTENSQSPEASQEHDASGASDVVFVRDERIQGNITVVESDDDATDEEQDAGPPGATTESIDTLAALPDIFQGRTFVIDASVSRAAYDSLLLARYVRAYGGLVLDTEPEGGADYVLAADSRRGERCVRPAWLWRCHRARALCPHHDYLLG